MSSLIPMVLILATGVAWHKVEPGGITTQQLRSTLSALVVNLLAPTLILYVILTTPLKEELYQVPITGLITISVCLALAFILFTLLLRTGYITRPQAGALILAASFGNGMGISLPAVEALFGADMASIPLIYDLLATVPFVWIIAVLVAAHFGTRIAGGHLGRELLLMPPVWAILIALTLRYFQWLPHESIIQAFKMMGQATVPLLLLMVGVNFRISRLKYILLTLPAMLIKLVVSPAVAFATGVPVGLSGEVLIITSITAAAPPVIVGIALADRFKLDSALFCTALTLGTAGYLLIAPGLSNYLTLFI